MTCADQLRVYDVTMTNDQEDTMYQPATQAMRAAHRVRKFRTLSQRVAARRSHRMTTRGGQVRRYAA